MQTNDDDLGSKLDAASNACFCDGAHATCVRHGNVTTLLRAERYVAEEASEVEWAVAWFCAVLNLTPGPDGGTR